MARKRLVANYNVTSSANKVTRESGTRSTYHLDHLGVYILGDDTALVSDVFEHLVQGLSLDLLALEVRAGVVEVEENVTLMELADEELGAFAGRGLCKATRGRLSTRGRRG